MSDDAAAKPEFPSITVRWESTGPVVELDGVHRWEGVKVEGLPEHQMGFGAQQRPVLAVALKTADAIQLGNLLAERAAEFGGDSAMVSSWAASMLGQALVDGQYSHFPMGDLEPVITVAAVDKWSVVLEATSHDSEVPTIDASVLERIGKLPLFPRVGGKSAAAGAQILPFYDDPAGRAFARLRELEDLRPMDDEQLWRGREGGVSASTSLWNSSWPTPPKDFPDPDSYAQLLVGAARKFIASDLGTFRGLSTDAETLLRGVGAELRDGLARAFVGNPANARVVESAAPSPLFVSEAASPTARVLRSVGVFGGESKRFIEWMRNSLAGPLAQQVLDAAGTSTEVAEIVEKCDLRTALARNASKAAGTELSGGGHEVL